MAKHMLTLFGFSGKSVVTARNVDVQGAADALRYVINGPFVRSSSLLLDWKPVTSPASVEAGISCSVRTNGSFIFNGTFTYYD